MIVLKQVRSNFLRTRFSRHFEISVYFQIFAALYTIVINTFHVCFWINFTYSESQETYLFEYITFWIVYWAVDKIETWMQVGALLTANGFRNRICRKQDYKSWQRVNHQCLKPSKKAITDGSTQNKDNIRRIRR